VHARKVAPDPDTDSDKGGATCALPAAERVSSLT
jgi:hypothetical protein